MIGHSIIRYGILQEQIEEMIYHCDSCGQTVSWPHSPMSGCVWLKDMDMVWVCQYNLTVDQTATCWRWEFKIKWWRAMERVNNLNTALVCATSIVLQHAILPRLSHGPSCWFHPGGSISLAYRLVGTGPQHLMVENSPMVTLGASAFLLIAGKFQC